MLGTLPAPPGWTKPITELLSVTVKKRRETRRRNEPKVRNNEEWPGNLIGKKGPDL